MVKPKHKVLFSVGGKTAALDMCAFCKNMADINHPEMCSHYENDYEDVSCMGFVKVDDVSKSLLDALEAFDPECTCKEGSDKNAVS